MRQKITFLLLKIFMVFALLGCSEEESDKVDATFEPSNPEVQFYDIPIYLYDNADGTPVTELVEGPWFKFKLKITNKSANQVVISNLNLVLTGVTTSQGILKSEVQFSSKDIIANKKNPSAATQVIAVIPGNQALTTDFFYVSKLSDLVTTGVYTVEATAIGWFGDVDAPSDRFEQKYFFTTD